MNVRSLFRGLAASTALAATVTAAVLPAAAQAQFGGIVYDPSNYAQNVLSAARALEQINNQIRMLQNQAASLINQARNLQSLPNSIVEPIQEQIGRTQQLLRQAQRIAYDVRAIERAFDAQYGSVPMDATQRALVEGAKARWTNSVAAFEDALKVQAGAVANIEGSRQALTSLIGASQSASGALQAAQAGNQLLALQARQLADLTATLAAMGRAQALGAAEDAAAKAQAREQLSRFLGAGTRASARSGGN